MEGLFILIAVVIVEAVVKKAIANKKNQSSQESQRYSPPAEPNQARRPGNLQDLIKQFEEAQRQASQGTLTPDTPPVEDLRDEYDERDEENFDEEDEVDLPVVTPANPNRVTFREIAESVIQWEEVSVDYLQQAFGFSENIAQQVLAELQAHHIVGRDMGEGYCDLLVHDKTELANLFKREQREADERKAAASRDEELQARRDAELQHQQELNALEERARQMREQAQQIESLPVAEEESLDDSDASTAKRKARKRTFDRAEIRRGFVWAKVLDEPRFKKRWSSRVR